MNKFQKIFDPRMFFYDFVKITGALPTIIFLRMKRIYVGNKKKRFKGKYIISSNHITLIDPIILINAVWNRRVTFVATQDFFDKPLSRFFFKGFGCTPINKQNPSLKTFKEVGERLNRGHIVSIFPEGFVSLDGEMNTFKSGIAMMAVMAQADILPVYIAKRKNIFERQKVVIGEKICCKDYIKGPFASMAELQTITDVLASKEKELETIYHNKYNKK